MAKVGSEGDGASPLTGVQVEGGLPPQAQAWRNYKTAAWTLSRLDILASDSEARHSETGWLGFCENQLPFHTMKIRMRSPAAKSTTLILKSVSLSEMDLHHTYMSAVLTRISLHHHSLYRINFNPDSTSCLHYLHFLHFCIVCIVCIVYIACIVCIVCIFCIVCIVYNLNCLYCFHCLHCLQCQCCKNSESLLKLKFDENSKTW